MICYELVTTCQTDDVLQFFFFNYMTSTKGLGLSCAVGRNYPFTTLRTNIHFRNVAVVSAQKDGEKDSKSNFPSSSHTEQPTSPQTCIINLNDSVGGGSKCVTHVWRRKCQLLRLGYHGSCCYPGVIADEVRMSNVADLDVRTPSLSLSLSIPRHTARQITHRVNVDLGHSRKEMGSKEIEDYFDTFHAG